MERQIGGTKRHEEAVTEKTMRERDAGVTGEVQSSVSDPYSIDE